MNTCRSLLTETIESFLSLFLPSNTALLPIFRLELCLEDGSIFFFPSVADLEAAMEFVVSSFSGSLQNFGQIQVNRKRQEERERVEEREREEKRGRIIKG